MAPNYLMLSIQLYRVRNQEKSLHGFINIPKHICDVVQKKYVFNIYRCTASIIEVTASEFFWKTCLLISIEIQVFNNTTKSHELCVIKR